MCRIIRQARETGDFRLLGMAYYYMAFSYYQSGERDIVLPYIIKSVTLLEHTNDYKAVITACNLCGAAYLSQENYQLALSSYSRAYRIAKRHRNRTYESYSMNNLADCYEKLGDYDTTIKLLRQCMELDKRTSNAPYSDLTSSLPYMNLADCYEKLGDYDKALECLETVADRIENAEPKMWLQLYYEIRASVLYSKGDLENAGIYLDKSLSFDESAGDNYINYEMFEKLLHRLIEIKDFERAEKTLEKLTLFADRCDHLMNNIIRYRAQAAYLMSQNDREGALSASLKLNELYDRRIKDIRNMQLSVHKKHMEAENEIIKLNNKLHENEKAASRDPLSKLLNRAALLKEATAFFEIAASKKEKIGAVFIDIDYFKQCNDTYGHAKGDEIIREVARACLKEETASVKFARYGGDEFFGIIHGFSDEKVIDTARRICERIRKADIPNIENPNGHRVTLSVGLVNVAIGERSDTIIDIANYADKALYCSKDKGKNRICFFDYDHFDEKGKRDPYIMIDF